MGETVYEIELMPKAIKDLNGLQKREAQKIVTKIRKLEEGLIGDVKKLANFTPEYRLRVGNYRALFEAGLTHERFRSFLTG